MIYMTSLFFLNPKTIDDNYFCDDGDLFAARDLAARSGWYPYSLIIINTRLRVRGLTPGCSLTTRETVEIDTPANSATCFNVIDIARSQSLWERFHCCLNHIYFFKNCLDKNVIQVKFSW